MHHSWHTTHAQWKSAVLCIRSISKTNIQTGCCRNLQALSHPYHVPLSPGQKYDVPWVKCIYWLLEIKYQVLQMLKQERKIKICWVLKSVPMLFLAVCWGCNRHVHLHYDKSDLWWWWRRRWWLKLPERMAVVCVKNQDDREEEDCNNSRSNGWVLARASL
jgi:hypothetical protein